MMTREQERHRAIDRNSKMLYYDWERRRAYMAGVEWADANPRHQWVPVEEALPPSDEYVLVKLNTNRLEVCCLTNGEWVNNYNDVVKGVTHWHVLPQIPREEMYK